MMTPSSRPSPNHQQLHSQVPPSPNHHQHTNGNNGTSAMQIQSAGSHQTASQSLSGSYMPSSGHQQSPNHNNSQMMHSNSLHTPNTHPNNSHINQSPNHHLHHSNNEPNANVDNVLPYPRKTDIPYPGDWSWNSQNAPHNQHHTGNGDLFNQQDRVNLNTRLKTMILSKNDQKDPNAGSNNARAAQQQPPNSQAGHFLSYSHHLRDINTDSNLNNSNTDLCLPSVQSNPSVEPNGGGGVSSQHWKSPLLEAKPPDDFHCSQQPQQHNLPQQPQQPPVTHDQSLDIRSGFNKMADKSHIIGQDVDKNLCMPYSNETHHTNSKSKSSSSSLKSSDTEKPVKKPAPKRQRKKPNASAQSSKFTIFFQPSLFKERKII